MTENNCDTLLSLVAIDEYVGIDALMQKAYERDARVTAQYRILDKNEEKIKVGASDMACASKFARNVMFGRQVVSLSDAIRMRKGNIAESLIENNFNQLGIDYERQGEYSCADIFDFIVVHPDILVDLNEATPKDETAKKFIDALRDMGFKYLLIEIKTTNALPPEAHEYWTRQVSVQADAIANGKGVLPTEIYAILYAIELNDGHTKQFEMFYDEEEVLLAKDDALSAVSVLEDWLQWASKEKETMELSIDDVNKNIGNLCSACEWAADCLGKGKEIELPEEQIPTLEVLAKYSGDAKNIKALKDEIKERMLKLGAKKGLTKGYTVSLRGGNKKTEVDEDSYTKEEILKMAKANPNWLVPNKNLLTSMIGNVDEDFKWVVDGHTKEKTTPISIIINKVRKKV